MRTNMQIVIQSSRARSLVERGYNDNEDARVVVQKLKKMGIESISEDAVEEQWNIWAQMETDQPM